MLRSMYSGVSGLRSHQTMMDVIGNNIANVNTVGFKTSTAVFQDLLSQQLTGAGAPTAINGGTNPAQVGLGVKLAGTSLSFTQGANQMTGKSTDLAIQGDGFFSVKQSGQSLYTRAGALSFDATGRLVTPDGGTIQGWVADSVGNMNTNATPGDLLMPVGQSTPPSATANIVFGGNLDANATAPVKTTVTAYDKLGQPISMGVQFTKQGANDWKVDVDSDGDGTYETSGGADLTFGGTVPGQLDAPNTRAITMTNGQAVTLDFGPAGGANSLTQYNGASSATVQSQDGYTMGALQSFSIGADGVVTGVFTNGHNRPVGQIALANFSNPAGLESVGGSMFRETVNSGLAQVGSANSGGRGTLAGSTLEMSNVDLAREFTNLIVAERGFQANSKVITASDEMLQDLVNLKR
jgi:flagellar hook protein FlgE